MALPVFNRGERITSLHLCITSPNAAQNIISCSCSKGTLLPHIHLGDHQNPQTLMQSCLVDRQLWASSVQVYSSSGTGLCPFLCWTAWASCQLTASACLKVPLDCTVTLWHYQPLLPLSVSSKHCATSSRTLMKTLNRIRPSTDLCEANNFYQKRKFLYVLSQNHKRFQKHSVVMVK